MLCLCLFPFFWWAHDHMVVGFITTNVPMQSVPIIANVVSSNPSQTRCSQYIKSMYFKFLYRISGNVCGFWLKKKALNFCRFFPCGLKILAPKKKIVRMTGSNNWSDVMINNWCTLQWSLEEKNISNSLESFQKLQFLNIHFINFNFVLRNYFFSLFSRSILLTGNTIAMKGTYIPYRICQ